jgi:hypothetical protein
MIRKGKEMKFTALQNSSAFTAVLVASSAFASMTTLTASNITGTGLYFQDPTIWSIQFTFDGDLAQTSLDGDFGNWTLTVTGSNGSSWSKSKSETNGGLFAPITNGRLYFVDIGDGTDGTNAGLTPPPTNLNLTYTTKSNSGVFMTLGEALDYSALSSTQGIEKGRLSVTHVNAITGIQDGEIWGTFTVPAPGAVALIGLAGMVAGRRRRN